MYFGSKPRISNFLIIESWDDRRIEKIAHNINVYRYMIAALNVKTKHLIKASKTYRKLEMNFPSLSTTA